MNRFQPPRAQQKAKSTLRRNASAKLGKPRNVPSSSKGQLSKTKSTLAAAKQRKRRAPVTSGAASNHQDVLKRLKEVTSSTNAEQTIPSTQGHTGQPVALLNPSGTTQDQRLRESVQKVGTIGDLGNTEQPSLQDAVQSSSKQSLQVVNRGRQGSNLDRLVPSALVAGTVPGFTPESTSVPVLFASDTLVPSRSTNAADRNAVLHEHAPAQPVGPISDDLTSAPVRQILLLIVASLDRLHQDNEVHSTRIDSLEAYCKEQTTGAGRNEVTPQESSVQHIFRDWDLARLPTKVKSALTLSCSASRTSCEDQRQGLNGDAVCAVGLMWAQCLKDRPAGHQLNSGSLLGQTVSENLRNAKSNILSFFPDQCDLFDLVFMPTISKAGSILGQTVSTHVKQFYENSKVIVDAEIVSCLKSVHRSRKRDMINAFTHFSEGISPASLFTSSADIDNGLYRRSEQSPVDNPAFVKAVCRTFRIETGKVSLLQLAFCCIVLIRHYTAGRVNPMIYRMVPKATHASVPYKCQQEMLGLMSAVLAKEFLQSQEGELSGYNTWKSPLWEVVHQEGDGTEWLQSFIQKISSTGV